MCGCVAVLDPFLIVMRCHVQVITVYDIDGEMRNGEGISEFLPTLAASNFRLHWMLRPYSIINIKRRREQTVSFVFVFCF